MRLPRSLPGPPWPIVIVWAVVAVAIVALLFAGLACGSGGPGTTSPTSTSPSSSLSTAGSPTSGSSVPGSTTISSSTATAGGSGAGADWPCYHHDPARTGVSSDQRALGQPRQLWTSAQLDGQLIYAQPLVVGSRVFAATEGNTVAALDAATGAVVWQTALGPPVPGNALPCGDIDPSGITGTPVIDTAAGVLYAVAFLQEGPRHELFALDIATGAIHWHRTVDPPGLSPLVEQLRGALALAGDRVYIAYGGLYGDCGAYKGAVVSVAADGTGGLTSYVVPTKRMAGIWNPSGPVADGAGDLWAVTGNSESQSQFDYGDSVLRLSSALKVLDYFAPQDWASLNAADLDLSSLGPVLLPGNRVLAMGKTGTAYVLDRGHLGGVGQPRASSDTGLRPFGSAAVMGSTVFVPTTGSLAALDLSSDTAKILWRTSGGAGSPIVAAGRVWSLAADGTLEAVDPTTGAVGFTLKLGKPASRFITPSAAGGRLFVADGTNIVAVGLR